eukprot:710608-Prorocentrum_minimum.AAC.1
MIIRPELDDDQTRPGLIINPSERSTPRIKIKNRNCQSNEREPGMARTCDTERLRRGLAQFVQQHAVSLQTLPPPPLPQRLPRQPEPQPRAP